VIAKTVGERLKQARESRRMTLEAASRDTRIPRASLASLESDAFSALPAPVYTRGFLRLYARHLGLDAQEILESYESQTGAGAVAEGSQGEDAAVVPAYLAPPERGPRTLTPVQLFLLFVTAATLAIVLFAMNRKTHEDIARAPQSPTAPAEVAPAAAQPGVPSPAAPVAAPLAAQTPDAAALPSASPPPLPAGLASPSHETKAAPASGAKRRGRR